VKQQYLPDTLQKERYFETSDNSKYERQLQEVYEKLKSLQSE